MLRRINLLLKLSYISFSSKFLSISSTLCEFRNNSDCGGSGRNLANIRLEGLGKATQCLKSSPVYGF